MAGFAVLDAEVAQLHFVVEAGGASAAGDGVGVVRQGTCQLVGGDFDWLRNQAAGKVNAVNRVILTRPFQGLRGRAAVAVKAQRVDPAGSGNKGAVFLVVGLAGPVALLS